MNREIKFRAWDTRGKSWLYPYPEGFHLFGETTCFDLIRDQMHERYPGESSLLLMNEVEVVQYTGLKDKNGKEIYEGDIIRLGNWGTDERWLGVGSVVWDTDVEGWGIYPWFSFLEWRDDYRKCMRRSEVIGNIYENPELLEGK